MSVWVDVVARARGLRTHRLAPASLHALRRAPDLAALGRALRQTGFPVDEGERRAPALDLAVRRRAASELRILVRWCGPRAAELPVIFEDEDRRSLRALLRGSLQRAPTDARLAGLVPTPTLPERALSELAEAPSPAAVAALLTIWGHPFAPGLRLAAGAAAPDPLALDIALDRAWAARARAGAKRGGPELTRFVADAVDLANAGTALVMAGSPRPRVTEQFLEGGRHLDRARYVELLAKSRATATGLLAATFAETPYAPVFRAAPLHGLDEAILTARVAVQRAAARRAPLGPAPVLWYALELRAETVAVSRIIWGVALGAPSEILAPAGAAG